MGLIFATDLEQWKRWQARQNPLRRIRSIFGKDRGHRLVLGIRGESPAVLVALEAATPTQYMSLLQPLHHMGSQPIAILAPQGIVDLEAYLPPGPWVWKTLETEVLPTSLRELRQVLAVGNYLPAGRLAHSWCTSLSARFNVIQHGLLTPHAPPLPKNSHVLAFSQSDFDFWASGRNDLTVENIGSQLLWNASHQHPKTSDHDAKPVFLGQLHGSELPRRGKARAAAAFCLETGSRYRPHPAEIDKLSRLQHQIWESRGIKIDRSSTPLTDLPNPVVSVFSTGILEAAARGIPAWVIYPMPPAWLEEFWERYGLSRWGSNPTKMPDISEIEPAKTIAICINNDLGSTQ